MNPKYLVQLATIIELGSVTKAAQKLNTTQPTLSRTLKVIEDRIGGAVLRRGRHGVTPTEIGARLAEAGREIMWRSQQAETTIQQWKHGRTGELRVGVGPMLATTVMGDFFAEMLVSPPIYGVKVYCEYAARLVERLNNNQLDVAIIPYDLNRGEDGLVREKLFQDRLSVFVGGNDPLVGKADVHLQDLSLHKWISVGEVAGLFDVTRDTLDHFGLPNVAPVLENTGDVTMTFRILELTKSCSMLPFRLLGSIQNRFNIAPINLNIELPTRNVGVWTTSPGRDLPEILDFLKRLRRYIAHLRLS
jgi:DNA-binding transcriptional LysR family regulator|tara:strand:- start:169 stop:1080 length:912 start_codon:yes stop_codon:yes gene_type:complete